MRVARPAVFRMFVEERIVMEIKCFIFKKTHTDSYSWSKKFALDDYRTYIQGLALAGVVETQLHQGHLEYVQSAQERAQFPDGIECTVYVKNPPVI